MSRSTCRVDIAQLIEKLNAAPYRPHYPAAADRARWEEIKARPAQQKWCRQIVAEAEKFLQQPVPVLTAAALMAYQQDGNRERYETSYFARRSRLGVLVLSEAIEYQGRFVPDILELIWAILGEVSWCTAGHDRYVGNDPLPAVGKAPVELFSCATGMVLAETVQLLGDELRSISPSLLARIGRQVDERLLQTFEDFHGECWWMSGASNWTVWCAMNLTGSILTFLEHDHERQAKLLHLLLGAVERYLNHYSPDGGCDEGSSYWSVSPQTMLVMLDYLNERTNGAFASVFTLPLIKKMGEYIADVNLCGSWSVSVADGSARPDKASPGAIYRYGKLVNSGLLQSYACYTTLDAKGELKPYNFMQGTMGVVLTFSLYDLCFYPAEPPAGKLARKASVLYPDLGLAVGRQNVDIAAAGMIFYLKGGHNDENHNHNDCGQFSLFYDGVPIVVDPGIGAYTRQTFSGGRYELWCCGAAGHNPPKINGIEQVAGREYAAKLVSHHADDREITAAFDLTKAYRPESKLKKLVRQARLDLAAGVFTVTDQIEGEGPYECGLVLAVAPEILDNHTAKLGNVTLQLTAAKITGVEVIDCASDHALQRVWGQALYRLNLAAVIESSAAVTMRFS